jgi:SAM-dependent methyltransferase
MRRVDDRLEVLDRPTPPAERAASLRDVERLNAWFGGDALTLLHVQRAVRRLPRDRIVRILDVGAGAGGLALRLARWARRRGRPIRVLAVDWDGDTARMAGRATATFPEISIMRADALALPVRAGGVDLVVSSLTLHHLTADTATAALAEMTRAARLGFIVNDLWRSRLGVALVWLVTRLLGCHWISRHDGPLSVRRSYSPAEIRALAANAGVERVAVHRYPWLVRVVAVSLFGAGPRNGPRTPPTIDPRDGEAR